MIPSCPLCSADALVLSRSLAGVWQGHCAQCGAQCLPLAEAQQADVVERLRKPQGEEFSLPCPTCEIERLRPALTSRPVARRPLGCLHCGTVWRHAPVVAPSAVTTEPLLDRLAPEARPAWADGPENAPPVQLAVFLAAGAFVLMLTSVGIGSFLLDATIGMASHELGHALAYWLCGWVAIPLPYFTAAIAHPGRALVLVELAALIAAAGWCWRTRHFFLLFLAGLAAAVAARYGLFGDEADHDVLFAAAGVGGEIVFGALLVVAYFHRALHRTSWDLSRYACLLLGLALFQHQWLKWAEIVGTPSLLPVGSLFGGRDDTGGDMNRLLRELWTAEDIARGYVALAEACAYVIAAHALVLAARAWRWTIGRRSRATRGTSSTADRR